MVTLKDDVFGSFNGEQVRRFTWVTEGRVEVSVISYGATITSIKVPDRYGDIKDVVLGFDDMMGYQRPDNPYFGATIGRCANRISGAQFILNDETYILEKNIGQNHLHGGRIGFDKVNWKTYVDDTKVTFVYLSKDLEEGYPGDLLSTVSYQLTADGTLHVEFLANTTKPTVVNLTNHSYFNLAGHDAGAEELLKHVVAINADKITEVGADAIPTGKQLPVGGTPFDLRVPICLGDVISSVPPGFDHDFCITNIGKQDIAFVSRVVHPQSGRYLEVYSDQPGVQFYTSNFLPSPDESAIPGKSGVGYRKHGAFCLETQNHPDAINSGSSPSVVVNPGTPYRHRVIYFFGKTEDSSPEVKFF